MNENATLSDYIAEFTQHVPWARRHPLVVRAAVIMASAAVLVALFSLSFGLVLGRFW